MFLGVNANQLNMVEVDEVPELLQQHTLVGRTRAAQHRDLGSQRAPGVASDHLPHVLLSHHGGLQSGQVKAIAFTSFVEVPFVLDVLGEVVHG